MFQGNEFCLPIYSMYNALQRVMAEGEKATRNFSATCLSLFFVTMYPQLITTFYKRVEFYSEPLRKYSFVNRYNYVYYMSDRK